MQTPTWLHVHSSILKLRIFRAYLRYHQLQISFTNSRLTQHLISR